MAYHGSIRRGWCASVGFGVYVGRVGFSVRLMQVVERYAGPRWGATLVLLAAIVLAAKPASSQVVEATAVTGTPWGVARVRIPVGMIAALDPDPRVAVKEANGRMLYPAIRPLEMDTRAPAERAEEPPNRRRIGGGRLLSRLGQMVRNAAAEPNVRQLVGYEVLFLVPGGKEPLTIIVDSPSVARLTVTPLEVNTIEYRAILTRWWDAYRKQNQDRIDAGDYPPLVETYLTEMLGLRLGLPTDEPPAAENEEPNRLLSTLELLTGAERLQVDALKRSAAGDWPLDQTANLPLPPGPTWAPLAIKPLPEQIEIEDTAQRVPPECFYIRFGDYSNYMWFQDISAENGGDILQAITLRGIDRGASQRLQDRLNLKASELARVFGPQVVEDMALIGHDLMLESGPAMGVLFKAKNALILRTSFNNDRQALAAQDPTARLTTVKLAGRDVSLLDSADHHLRSYWVDDGVWQFITTSRYLAERFIQVGQGQPSLGQTQGFRYARQLMPVDSGLTVFAYFSNDFFQHLVSPEYLIETGRRLRAESELSMVALARLAASNEGSTAQTIDELVAGGYLPVGFGHRADGSGPIVLEKDYLDSLRGRRGSFVPVRDLTVSGVTPEEAAEYKQLAEFYTKDWRQMDPLIAGIKRTVEPQGRERLQIRAEIAPLVPEKYGWVTRQLGPPTRVALQFAPDDLVQAQAHVITDLLGGTVPPHYLFAGIKDTEPPPLEELDGGVIKTYLILRGIPGYIGAWPYPGVIDRLPLGLGRGTPAGPNTSRLIGGVYRWQASGFSVLSFMPEVLSASTSYLKATEGHKPAQVRVKIGNLVGSKLEGWANDQLYQRGVDASVAGAEFLKSLTDQLQVEREEALVSAKQLLGGTIKDPLGGQYQLVADIPGLPPRWRSTLWPKEPRIASPAPPEFIAPPLRWFRGLNAELTQFPDRMSLEAEIEIQR